MITKSRRTKPRLTIMLLLVILVAESPAYGQSPDGSSHPENPQKKWQLKFSVGPNLMPDQFDGIKIYIQQGLSRNRAIRFGIGLRKQVRDFKRNFRIVDPPDGYYSELNLDDDLLMISFDFNYIGYIGSNTAIVPYIGIGPYFDYSLNNRKRTNQFMDNPPESDLREFESEALDAGFRAILGGEWQLSSHLILQVEYSLRLYYERYHVDTLTQFLSSSPGFIEEENWNVDFYKFDAGDIKTGFSILF
jgi:hypothetical protein